MVSPCLHLKLGFMSERAPSHNIVNVDAHRCQNWRALLTSEHQARKHGAHQLTVLCALSRARAETAADCRA